MSDSTTIRLDTQIRDRLQAYKNKHGMTYNGAILQFLEWAETDSGDGDQGERVPSSATSFSPDSSLDEADESPLTASEPISAQSMAEDWGHQLYLGVAGAGKTTTAAYQAQHFLEHDPNTTIFIVSPVGGYERLTDSYDGTYIDYDELTELEAQTNHAKNQLLYCDLQAISGTRLTPTVTETVLDWLYEQTQTVEGRAVLLVDAADMFLQTDATAQLFERMVRHARKQGVAVWMVVQPGQGTHTHLPAFLNAAQTVYLYQLHRNEELASRFGLSQRQREFIWTAQTGWDSETAEILRRTPSTGWQPFTVDIADDVLDKIVGAPAQPRD